MAEELVFRIKDRQVLQNLVNDVETMYREIKDINPNIHPIQLHTKIRWQSQMAITLDFLQKLLPAPNDPEK